MALVGLDGSTVNGTNTDLVGPILHGLASMSVEMADPSSPVDADVTGLDSDTYDGVLNIAKLKLLETIQLLIPLSTPYPGQFSAVMDLADFAKTLGRQIDELRRKCEKKYGYDLSPLQSGVINHGITYVDT